MKKTLMIAFLLLGTGLSACAAPTVQPVATAAVNLPLVEAPAGTPVMAAPAGQVLNTTMGELVVVSSRFVDEVNGAQAGPGQKILLVVLDRPAEQKIDPSNFSLEDFQKMMQDTTAGQVHLRAGGQETVISTMAGWVGEARDEFAVGFRVPEAAQTFQLVWPGNDPIEITP